MSCKRIVKLCLLLLLAACWLCGCSDDGTAGSENGGLIDGFTTDVTAPVPDVFSNDGGGPPLVDVIDSDGSGKTEDGTVPEPDTVDDTHEDEDTAPEVGGFGYPCQDNSQCLSGFCVESELGKVCTETCLENCPDGWSCEKVQNMGGDVIYLCLSMITDLCRPCDDDDECNSGLAASDANRCLSFEGSGSFCGVKCSANPDCSEGYECVVITLETGAETKQCVRAEGECECSDIAIEVAASTLCYKANDDGYCEGERVCTPEGLSDCSAIDPSPETCNGIDDDCDGEIDPQDSIGCVNYWLDQDDDGFGLGLPECLCESPGIKYVTIGGDCNDASTAQHPDVLEMCNGIDDNCDEQIDENGAVGCIDYFADLDEDDFGDPNNIICSCSPQPIAGLSLNDDDCDDQVFEVNPDATEICDGIDNNCTDGVDEGFSEGCTPYYFDQDLDGYGLEDTFKCLCEPETPYVAESPGDCDDTDPEIAPFKPEICDGIDNNCNGEIDEGDPAVLCGIVTNGSAGCVDGACAVVDCIPGFYDIDFDHENGCECAANAIEVSGNTCQASVDVGTVVDGFEANQGSTITVQGNAVYSDESDWYVFHGQDGPDANECDTYHVRARFLNNPLNAYTFDVYRGSCAGSDQVCVQSTDYEFFTDFFNPDAQAASQARGECPCKPPGATITSSPSGECTDNSALYYIRVYRLPEVPPSCDGYTLELTNGVYN